MSTIDSVTAARKRLNALIQQYGAAELRDYFTDKPDSPARAVTGAAQVVFMAHNYDPSRRSPPRFPGQPIDIEDRDTDRYGTIEAALRIIDSAPQFDSYSAAEIEDALGDLIAPVVTDGEDAVYATNEDFDITDPLGRQNNPFVVGERIPDPTISDNPELTFVDWPTDGPLFETADGQRAQFETRNVYDELGPDSYPPGQLKTDEGKALDRIEELLDASEIDRRLNANGEVKASIRNRRDASAAETGEATTQRPEGQLRDEQGRIASDPIKPEQNIPDAPGDVMGETPSLWPGADDVFRTIAPTAAQLAVNDYNSGNQPRNAAVIAANNTLDEWLGYSGDMRRQAEEALANWLIERVFDGQYDMTRFQFDPEVLPVDSEMRSMALRFIESDLQGQVRDDKIEDAKQLFIQRATDPDLTQPGLDVQDFLEDTFEQANVDIPRNRARRFNPEDQRAVGGAAGTDSMDVVLPRGIAEEELGVVAGNMSDDGYDRELYSPLSRGQFPTDPQLLIRLAEVMEEYAEIRRNVSADYDGQGFYLRLAGLMYQAVDR